MSRREGSARAGGQAAGPTTQGGQGGRIGLVLPGGGARGAYELGALSVLLPVLEDKGERPRVYVGTSIGALQTAYLARRATDDLDEVLADGCERWRSIRLHAAVSSPLSPAQLCVALRYLGTALGVVRPPPSFLATGRLKRTVDGFGPFDQIGTNVENGSLHSVAVVATSSATGRSVVFHHGGKPDQEHDDRRGIDYVSTKLTAEHVRASAAIPSAFPAVQVRGPGGGWYVDGGTRLNAPIKPAIELGAERLVIVGLHSNQPGPEPGSARRPDAIDGAGHLTQAILADPLYNDLQTLVTLNRVARAAGDQVRYREIPYIFIAPNRRDRVGELARKVFRDHYTGLRNLASRHIRLLGRLVDAGRSAAHGELLSYLFFAPEFVDGLIDLGKEDAHRWLDTDHDDYPWRVLDPPQ
jgi:NTE family protein